MTMGPREHDTPDFQSMRNMGQFLPYGPASLPFATARPTNTPYSAWIVYEHGPRRSMMIPRRWAKGGGSSRGTALIIVMWLVLGLTAVALYFSHSMMFEYRAGANYLSARQAEHIIEGACRYVTAALTQLYEDEGPGLLPIAGDHYLAEEVPLGEGVFWIIGRGDPDYVLDRPVYGLVDEASKLNLNTATIDMLYMLPDMTEELAASIIDWRDEDDDVSDSGAESPTYLQREDGHEAKNAPFGTVDELRLVYGADPYLLEGEDTNYNGYLDTWENDGDLFPPTDDQDGRLRPGLLDLVTVYSREPNTRADGSARLNINDTEQREDLQTLFEEQLGEERARELLAMLPQEEGEGGGGPGGGGPGGGGGGAAGGEELGSILEFYLRSGMTQEELALVEGDITTTDTAFFPGLINVNTARAEVLACLPGMDESMAASLVSYRVSLPVGTSSIGWVAEVLEEETLLQIAPYITGRAYQFSVDIAAVGQWGRGYRRTLFVLDASAATPEVVYRRDRTSLGWALGPYVREELPLILEDYMGYR